MVKASTGKEVQLMSRLHTPPSVESSPSESLPIFQSVSKLLGCVPNMFRLIGNSPAALEGYWALNAALSRSSLDAACRERIALAVAQANGCDYCLSAHTYLAQHAAKLDEREIAASREGTAQNPKIAAAVRLAALLVRDRGAVSPSEIAAARAAGYGDREIVEIILLVALNTLTNYVNNAAATEIDFPIVRHRHQSS